MTFVQNGSPYKVFQHGSADNTIIRQENWEIKETSTTSITYNLPERGGDMEENRLDVQKVFEAIAYILGKRENVEITVVSVRKKPETEDKTA